MAKVIIDASVSLDGFVAGPNDGKQNPLGERGGEGIFQWYFSGKAPHPKVSMFKPEGANIEVVDEMFKEAGAMLTGRRTYEIAAGWPGGHPVPGLPIFILTHKPPPPDQVPKGQSKLTFVTDGIESAVRQAKAAAGAKHVGIGGASAAQQALRAGLVDEIYLHVAPIVLGAGVRLLDELGDHAFKLDLIRAFTAPHATHLRYRVLRR